jgi:hypothetical protein
VQVMAAQKCRFGLVICSVGLARKPPGSAPPTWSPTCPAWAAFATRTAPTAPARPSASAAATDPACGDARQRFPLPTSDRITGSEPVLRSIHMFSCMLTAKHTVAVGRMRTRRRELGFKTETLHLRTAPCDASVQRFVLPHDPGEAIMLDNPTPCRTAELPAPFRPKREEPA